MKTLIYATISMMAVAVLAGCGSKSNNNSSPYYPYGGNYNQYGGGSCLPTGVPLSQAVCQQYGYSFNGSTCVSPQGQVINPGSCNGNYYGNGGYYGNGYTGGYGNGYTGGYGNGYTGGYGNGYTGYSGYYYGSTTPYGYPTYIPTMPIY